MSKTSYGLLVLILLTAFCGISIAAEEPESWLDTDLIFGEPAELIGTSSAARHQGKIDSSAEVAMFFDTPPDLVLLYEIGASYAAGSARDMTTTELNILVAPGTYELLVAWGNHWSLTTFVFRENVIIAEGENRIDVARSEAVHQVDIKPIAKNGQPLQSGFILFRQYFKQKNTERPLILRSGGSSFPNTNLIPQYVSMAFSDMSDSYIFEAFIGAESPEAPRGHEMYTMHQAVIDGVDSDRVIEIGADDWGDAVLVHTPPEGVDQIRFRHSATNRPFDLDEADLGRGSINCKGPAEPLEAPFEQTVHFMPRPDPETFLGYFRVYAHPYDQCTNASTLYVTPFMTWDNGLQTFMLGSTEPVHTSQGRLHVGDGALFWFGRTANLEDRIVVASSNGRDLLPFLPQSGSVGLEGVKVVEVRLHQGSSLVYDSVWDFNEIDSVQFDIVPGPYSLEMIKAESVEGMRIVRATAKLTGNTLLEDRDPPFVQSVRLVEKGQDTDALTSAGAIEIDVRDALSATRVTRAVLVAVDRQIDLVINKADQGTYVFRVPLGFESTGDANLEVAFEDEAGNLTEMTSRIRVERTSAQPGGDVAAD